MVHRLLKGLEVQQKAYTLQLCQLECSKVSLTAAASWGSQTWCSDIHLPCGIKPLGVSLLSQHHALDALVSMITTKQSGPNNWHSKCKFPVVYLLSILTRLFVQSDTLCWHSTGRQAAADAS